jgi:hypothetical protein
MHLFDEEAGAIPILKKKRTKITNLGTNARRTNSRTD